MARVPHKFKEFRCREATSIMDEHPYAPPKTPSERKPGIGFGTGCLIGGLVVLGLAIALFAVCTAVVFVA